MIPIDDGWNRQSRRDLADRRIGCTQSFLLTATTLQDRSLHAGVTLLVAVMAAVVHVCQRICLSC